MIEIQEPIALKDSAGTVRAWACPRCYRVSMSVHCGGPDGREMEAGYSRERALECGVCRECGVTTNCNTYALECAECRAKAEVKRQEHHERHRDEWAQQAEQHRIAREVYLTGLLSDIRALQSRDWADEEDLATDLVPLLLARLTERESPPSADAVDPHADSTGTLSPREKGI